MKSMLRRLLLLVFLAPISTAIGFAQGPPLVAFSPMNIEFMSAPIAFDSEPVTGAPYSAEAVTEIVQTFADGNRIVRESTAKIARDGKGRTRREQGLAMFGPLVSGAAGAPGSDEPRHIHISDPSAKTTIMLDPQHRMAHRIPTPHFKIAALNKAGIKMSEKAVGVDHFEMALPAPAPGMESVHLYSGRNLIVKSDAEPVIDNLGQQFMEGVMADGTRTTMTIPAGQIGNELPIKVVSERWFSPELKVLVMSRQSDPRFGETTYRLTNISRSEPAPDLFEVPTDYQVFDPGNDPGTKGNREVFIERKFR